MCTHAHSLMISVATISFSSPPLQHKQEHRGPSVLAGSFFLTGILADFKGLRGSATFSSLQEQKLIHTNVISSSSSLENPQLSFKYRNETNSSRTELLKQHHRKRRDTFTVVRPPSLNNAWNLRGWTRVNALIPSSATVCATSLGWIFLRRLLSNNLLHLNSAEPDEDAGEPQRWAVLHTSTDKMVRLTAAEQTPTVTIWQIEKCFAGTCQSLEQKPLAQLIQVAYGNASEDTQH